MECASGKDHWKYRDGYIPTSARYINSVTGRCPHCGNSVEQIEVFIDLETNTLTIEGTSYFLSPKLAAFLYYIIKAFPRTARFEEIAMNVWGDGEKSTDIIISGTMAQYASMARRVLRKFGASIIIVSKVGYRFQPAKK